MCIRALRRLLVAASITLTFGLPAVALATPGPDDLKPETTRAGVVPRDLPGNRADVFAVWVLPQGIGYEVVSRGAQLPRAGVEYLAAREEGPGPEMQPAWFDAGLVFEEAGLNADEIPLDTVTRGAIMPLPADEEGAWDGEGVGPTGTDLP